ncbi:peptidoglycan DD-metalloendopeptidase family protein [Burkholderiaceae bacterium DAT-1]|nr:peptidoglycan DD-metalloendopeptidase family protein [Burkholderiaceae bacterium DAT-1]
MVKKGDTLYSIALDNGLDYHDIASANQLADPNLIKVGQVLKLPVYTQTADADAGAGVEIRPLNGPASVGKSSDENAKNVVNVTKPSVSTQGLVSYPKALKLPYNTDAETIAKQADGPSVQVASKPVPVKASDAAGAAKKVAEPKPVNPPSMSDTAAIVWAWPASGKVISSFSPSTKGIDISGKIGQPVYAAADGKVSFADSMREYGKIVIINHNKMYLSAYMHNSRILVKEHDWVKKGDKIAEMGSTDSEQVKLHFEIRQFGKPVDPTKYLTVDKS